MKKILVVADYVDESPIALEQAIELAQVYDTSLHIVHFCYVEMYEDLHDKEGVKEKVVASVRAQASVLLSQQLPSEVTFTHDVVWCKHIHMWVNDYVKAEKPCLVVKTGNRSESALYTPTDWHLLRECQVPVLISPRSKWRKTSNILAAIDLGTTSIDKLELNQKILRQAQMFAEHFGVEMHVCYAPPVSPVLKDLGIKSPDEVERKARKALEADVAVLAAQFDIPESHFHIRAGVPEKVIPSLAAEYKASLVVMGIVGRKGIKGKLIGNTAEKVLNLLKADVLALKPDE